MLVDNAILLGPSDIVADNVTSMPSSPVNGHLVYLITASGSLQPSLYMYANNQWNNLIDADMDPVT